MLYGELFLKNITGKKHVSLKNEKRISMRSNITLIFRHSKRYSVVTVRFRLNH